MYIVVYLYWISFGAHSHAQARTYHTQHIIIVFLVFSLSLSHFSDDWQTARQNFAEYFLIFIAPWNLSYGTCVPAMASNRIQYAALEKCIVATRGVRLACGFIGYAVAADFRAVWNITALHWTAHWTHYTHGITWIGCQMPQFDAYAAGLFNRHAIAWFQRNASISHETALHVHLLVGGHFHGRVHAENLQFH